MIEDNTKKVLKYPAFQQFNNTNQEFTVLWSETLQQYMVITEKEIYFQDGIIYPVKELASLKGFSDSMLQMQHTARQVFGAEVKILG